MRPPRGGGLPQNQGRLVGRQQGAIPDENTASVPDESGHRQEPVGPISQTH